MEEYVYEYVYMIHTREFKNSNQDIYKIGRTSQLNLKRVNSYPKGSKLHCQLRVANSYVVEKQIMHNFKKIFVQKLEIGLEYFEGNYLEMEDKFIDIVRACKNNIEMEIIDDPPVEIDSPVINDPPMEIDTFLTQPIEIIEIKPTKNPSKRKSTASNKTCKVCLNTFSTNANFVLHANRKIPCVPPNVIIKPVKYKFKCERCLLAFQTNKKLSSHLSRKYICRQKEKPDNIKLDLLYEKIKNEIEQLKQK